MVRSHWAPLHWARRVRDLNIRLAFKLVIVYNMPLYRRQGLRPSPWKRNAKKNKLDVRDIQKQNSSFFVPRIILDP